MDITEDEPYTTPMEAQQQLLAAITDIHRAFLGESESKQVFANMLHHICALSGSTGGAIAELIPEREGKPFLHLHAATLPAFSEEHLQAQPNAAGTSPDSQLTRYLEQILATGQPVIVNEPSPPLTRDGLAAAAPAYQTLFGVPLVDGGRILGVIVAADRPGGYPPLLIDCLAPLVLTCTTIMRSYRDRCRRIEADNALRLATQNLEAQTQDLQAARDQALAAAQAKSIFFAMMSHEMRTPLNAVIGIADLLLETPLNEMQAIYIKRIDQAANSLLTLINSILDLSKIESGRLEVERIPFDLWELIETTAEILSARTRGKALELITHIAADVPQVVMGDPTRLRQILTNLLDNAIKFTACGEIVLRVERAESASQRPLVHLAVSDTGIGIPADKLESIFEIFSQVDSSTTRKYGGTGLGLCISRRLAELMSGRMWAESTLGRGSTIHFTVELPAVPHERDAASTTPPSLRGQHILVVDDSATGRLAVKEILSPTGAHIAEASDGPTALAALHSAHAKRVAFQLVIIDCQMPGMDGFTVTEKVRASFDLATTPIIMLTSHAYGWDATRAQQLGIHSLIGKPIRRAALLTAVSAALGGNNPTPPVRCGSPPRPVPAATPERPAEPTPARRILLVEDLEDNRQIVAAFLRGTSFTLDLAEDGAMALQQFRSGQYDLVLMDMQMPVMDGYEATRAIRQWEREQGRAPTPIVALSANAFPNEIERGLRAGCTAYLTKPIRKNALLAVIDQYLGPQRRGRQPEQPHPLLDECRQPDGCVRAHNDHGTAPTPTTHDAPPTPTGVLPVKRCPPNSQTPERGPLVVHVDPDFEALLPRFMMNRKKEVEVMHRALAQQDLDTIRQVAHGMKGASGSYGFDRVTAMAATIEQAAATGTTAPIEAELARLATYLEHVQVIFDKPQDPDAG